MVRPLHGEPDIKDLLWSTVNLFHRVTSRTLRRTAFGGGVCDVDGLIGDGGLP
ncbi:hypothetical protein HQ394_18235 [Defluviicoccus vanus]|uniref:Uncharacterized protein n=1 Tax=Defluviicoccus vanus TaxID=111831 RepID=A0A7H1MX61_9PROT|nr:hypothetical protein HQ394_18235 [Defluviicoccus vanus]